MPTCQTRCQVVWQLCETDTSEDLLIKQRAELSALIKESTLPKELEDMYLENLELAPPTFRQKMIDGVRKSMGR